MRRYELVINEQPITVKVNTIGPGESQLEVDGVTYSVRLTRQEVLPSSGRPAVPRAAGRASGAGAAAPAVPQRSGAAGPGLVTAPIPGAVLEVFVKVGDKVEAGAAILKMEAMKMENTIAAPVSGTVASIAVAPGAIVEQGQELAVVA